MRCAKCLKIMRYATVCSQIWERTDRNAIILLIILFTFLSPPNTQLSLSPLWSPSLRCSLFLSHFHFFFISLTLFLSLHFGIIAANPTCLCASLSLSLSFFSYHYLSLFLFLSQRRRRFRFEAELADWSLPIWTSTRPGVVADLCSSSSTVIDLCFLSRRRRRFWSDAELADWSSPIWTSAHRSKTSTRRFEALLAQGQSHIFARHPPQSPIFAHHPPQLSPPISLLMVGWIWSLIDLLGWGFVEDFEFFILFIFYFVEVFGFGICWRIRWLWL